MLQMSWRVKVNRCAQVLGKRYLEQRPGQESSPSVKKAELVAWTFSLGDSLLPQGTPRRGPSDVWVK